MGKKEINGLSQSILESISTQILEVSKNIDEDIQKAAELLINHSGKIVVCGLGKSGLKFGQMAPKADAAFRNTAVKMNQNQQQSFDLFKKAFTKQAKKDGIDTSGSSNTSTQQGPKMKRPNISNQKYKNNLDQYKKDKEAYDAQSAEFKTRKGAGRPTKLDQARKSGEMEAAQKKNPIRIKRGTKEVMQDQ